MAKPIRATPELYGKDAKRFIQLMEAKAKSKMTKKEIELAKAIESMEIKC